MEIKENFPFSKYVAIRGNPWQSVQSVQSVTFFQALLHAKANLSQSALIRKPTVGK
jgi:hypothetical protein